MDGSLQRLLLLHLFLEHRWSRASEAETRRVLRATNIPSTTTNCWLRALLYGHEIGRWRFGKQSSGMSVRLWLFGARGFMRRDGCRCRLAQYIICCRAVVAPEMGSVDSFPRPHQPQPNKNTPPQELPAAQQNPVALHLTLSIISLLYT
ncbi:hypothetical protein EJ06DRAFT_289333 [Trichodelitschia bisporula]|uniref:Uncharacterized protein n=1 Tax=Trichodelitschia bisporula TaxID=703511 RepID=A0A6G1I689_9PEZI|nr:hypothetical protein EJ06DRAFT_289333 [Trichodelitschia bisporula]